MHDVKWIRENRYIFEQAMQKRGCSVASNKIVQLDENKRQLITLIQKLQQARKSKAKQIAQNVSHTSAYEFKMLKKDASDIKEKILELEQKLEADQELNSFLATLPNIPSDEVPDGKDETANIEIRKWGNIPQFEFVPKQHFELGQNLGLLDFEDSSAMSGSRFSTLKGGLAKLERALVAFMIDLHTSKYGFQEVSPPLLVREKAMYNACQLPKFADESYKTNQNMRLIPTAEVPLINLEAGKIIDIKRLPIRYVAYTPCFRSEAGAAGRDTRGIMRQHQFTKVELVSLTKAEESTKEHEYITNVAEEVLKQLGLPYRTMLLSAGDMGFSATKTYDLEVWLPGQNQYREISSCSNCGAFQARRLKTRYKDDVTKQTHFVHTLNGSALAIGRTIIAIMENYQQSNGSIAVPQVLQQYMGGQTLIK